MSISVYVTKMHFFVFLTSLLRLLSLNRCVKTLPCGLV